MRSQEYLQRELLLLDLDIMAIALRLHASICSKLPVIIILAADCKPPGTHPFLPYISSRMTVRPFLVLHNISNHKAYDLKHESVRQGRRVQGLQRCFWTRSSATSMTSSSLNCRGNSRDSLNTCLESSPPALLDSLLFDSTMRLYFSLG